MDVRASSSLDRCVIATIEHHLQRQKKKVKVFHDPFKID